MKCITWAYIMSFRKEKKRNRKLETTSLRPVSVFRLTLQEPSYPVTEDRKEKRGVLKYDCPHFADIKALM